MTEQIEIVDVTPQLAADWLALNLHNRNMRQRVVRAYAADMLAGNWKWNGDAVRFADDGTLLDGQHRLAAVADSGCTVRMLIVRGLPGSAQETVDGGAKRRFSDVLKLRGEPQAQCLASIVRRVTLWEAGQRGTEGKYAPTTSQMFRTLEKYPWLRDLASPSHQVAYASGLPASIIGFGWWAFSLIDAEDAEGFFERLKTGENISRGNPVYELRVAARNSRSVRGQRSERYLTAILIKAWNAYRDGREILALNFRPGGDRPERFPEPH